MNRPTSLTEGTLVHLKTDKEKRPWEIKNIRPNGTITIVRHNRHPSIYTTMYVTEKRLNKAEAQR